MTSRAPQTWSYRCPVCGEITNPHQRACAHCGAAIDVRLATDDSGWTELPPIADMTRIQCGRSTCQIEGNFVPVADVNLSAGDTVYFAHHVLLWKEPNVQIERVKMQGFFRRLMGGLPLIMTEARGPGHVAFSKDAPGEIVALPLEAGQSIDVQHGEFMLATGKIDYSYFATNIWYSVRVDKDTETFYPVGRYMDRFTAGGEPGLLLCHAAGNAFVRTLRAGQTLVIKPSALIYKDTSVQMNLHLEYPHMAGSSWLAWSGRHIWLRLTGPGRVAVQSLNRHVQDSPNRLAGCEWNTTQREW